MNKFILLIAFLNFSFSVIFAQNDFLGSWNILNLKYSHSNRLNFFAEAQIRSLAFYDHFHYYEYKVGINYVVEKNFKITLGGGSYQTYSEQGNFKLPKNNDEIRLWPQFAFYQEILGIKIEHRYRAEMRWTLKSYRNRFRYRAGFSIPFGSDAKGYKPFQLSLSNELFFSDVEPYFERNRAQIALNCKMNKTLTSQVAYLHQFDYKIFDEIGRDFLVVGFYIEFSRSNIEQLLRDVELKDN